jgi:hypothetical protein
MSSDTNKPKPDYSHLSPETRLYWLLVDEMEKVLTEGKTVVAGDEVVKVAPDASTLNVIRQFLRDNIKSKNTMPSLKSLLSAAEDDAGEALSNLPFPNKPRAN